MNPRSTPTTPLTFADVLDTLGHHTHTALCYKPADGRFQTIVNTPQLVSIAATGLPDADVWFAVNPVAGPPRTGPRGAADTVEALTCLWADLDIKPGACTTIDDAHTLIDDISAAIGTRPSIIISSGHGLQPLWEIDDDDNTVLDTAERTAMAAAILKRWGRLVATIAGHRGIAVDSVFDLPRILRVPGTTNHKGDPVPTSAVGDTGSPLTLGEICDRLDEYGVPELSSDPMLDEPVDTSTWTWAETTCGYVTKMIAAWATETPDARHPWMLACATRLACARRKGCITAAGHTDAIAMLTRRLEELCGSGSNARAVAPSEVRDGITWGEQRAAFMGETQIDRELGAHSHEPKFTVIDGDNIAAISRAARTEGATALAPAGQPIRASYTDLGNSQRLVHHHGHKLRYNPARSAWLSWDSNRWTISEDDSCALDAAIAVANALPEGDKEDRAFKTKSRGRAGLENMIAIARRDRRIRVTADELDADPFALNTPTGTIDLRSGLQHEHRPAGNHTKITATGYDPTLPTPRWDRFLLDTFNGDVEMIGYLQRVLGYAATGRVSHHVLPFLHGPGGNGKSVVTDTITRILGDYAITLPSSVLISNRYSHDTELARLAGARLAVCSEVPTDGRFDEERMKSLTGGDRITARFLYSNPFEFTPSHTLILSGNHQPAVEMGGESFWRRLRLIPFTHTVPEEKKVEGLADILIDEEGPGILAWIVAGAQDATSGLREPRSVIDATARYEREEDAFGQFVIDCLHLAPGSDVVKADTSKVRKVYARWCKDNGVGELSAQTFGREIRRRTGTSIAKSNDRKFYRGIALIEADIDDPRSGE
ncbi:DNA primase family protein [Gordonia insulae]|uniref:SF3 helicase domain-containing protein n=1 Tax=Gordonia insulae TaxID=2420509 RepID=A0A3G8JE93_9ACTN|nr:DNA primase family protein [Gordonia insulae]AZG43466.1 hypothetical protein D7316_00030 [Gordonia insulae]